METGYITGNTDGAGIRIMCLWSRTERRQSITGRPSIAPSAPKERVSPKPPEILNRHNSEMRRLEQYQSIQQKRLEREHSGERRNPPAGIPPAQLEQRQRTETGAFQEQIRREKQTLRNWQRNEERIMTAPSAPPHRRFDIPRTGGGRGQGRQQVR